MCRRAQTARTAREPIAADLWSGHLEGKASLGVIPIDEKNEARWGAIDVDVYGTTDHAGIARRVARLKLPMVVARSKSGGVHLFLFALQPVAAGLMIARLKQLAALLGFAGSEIFPKQAAAQWDRGDVGSWLNLPYFDGLKGTRYALSGDGSPLEFNEFLSYAESLRQSPAWFKEPITPLNDELPQGPPCLQHLIQLGFPAGTRNNGLFNLAVYARKADPDTWEDLTVDLNSRYMSPPLNNDEVQAVIKSVRRKEYGYRCSDQPITSHCNRDLCRSRKFGVGGGGADLLRIENLRKLATSPPLFFASIQGAVLELTGKQLQDPAQVQLACIEKLNGCPLLPKRDTWAAHLNEALAACEVIEAPDDASDEGRLWGFIESFCTGRIAFSREEILSGKPWIEDGRVEFLSEALMSFLERKRCRVQPNQVWALIRRNGGQHFKGRSIKGKKVAIWTIPEFARQTEPFEIPACIDGGSESGRGAF